jgi:hypothetical protein
MRNGTMPVLEWGSLDGWRLIDAFPILQNPDHNLLKYAARANQVLAPAFAHYHRMNDIPGVRDLLYRNHCLSQWHAVGLPVFELTHSMMAALLLTDPSGIPWSEVRFPFKAFPIRLPIPFWTSKVCDGANINYLWHESFVQQDESEMNVLWFGSDGPPAARDGFGSIWSHAGHDTVGKTMVAMLPTDEEDPVVSDEERSMLMGAYRILVNLSLYLSERMSPVLEGGPRRHSVPRPVKPTTYVIGREVKLDRRLVEAAKHWTRARGGDRAQWSISKRFVVRGHWRKQVFGKRIPDADGHPRWGQERRRVFVEPFWKGDGPVVLQRVYKVDEGASA